jgi:LemA protein
MNVQVVKCPRCGDSNSGAANYCGACGAPLPVVGGVGMKAGKAVLVFLGVMFIGALAVGGCAYSGYRRTIGLDESVKSAWADIEVVLKRRFDLIPNVVETVRGYARHEKELLQGIANVRQSYFTATSPADKARAASGLEGALSRLLVLQEKYPDLKANENFRSLQVELEGTENRVAEKRRRYNEAVKALNGYVRAFPGSMFAGWAGVKPAEYFEAGAAAQEAPSVKF